MIANHEHVTCFNRRKVRDWAASQRRRGGDVDLAERASEQATAGCLCCGSRPDVLVEHEARRAARIASHQ